MFFLLCLQSIWNVQSLQNKGKMHATYNANVNVCVCVGSKVVSLLPSPSIICYLLCHIMRESRETHKKKEKEKHYRDMIYMKKMRYIYLLRDIYIYLFVTHTYERHIYRDIYIVCHIFVLSYY